MITFSIMSERVFAGLSEGILMQVPREYRLVEMTRTIHLFVGFHLLERVVQLID